MQSHIAQVVTLTTYAHAIVTGRLAEAPSAFYPGNSSFTYCESVRFVDRARAGESWTETEYAPDPVAWLAPLKAAHASAVRMHYGATGGQALGEGHVSDRMLAAFAGGGGRWLIEVITPDGSDVWEPRWEVGDQDRADQRIWRVTYARVASAASTPARQAGDQDAVTRDLASTLTAIAAFARAQSLASFATAFESGLARLRSADPFEAAANADIVPPGVVPIESLRLLAAARAAWVFGGMGSWNDQGFEGETNAQYERLSDDLYRLLNVAIVTAANGGD
jgi:hypothetical protein